MTAKNEQTSVPATSSIRIEWMWQSNPDPSSKSQPDEWSYYSDVENLIIEEAFLAKQTHVMLDDCCINFEHGVRISNYDANKKKPLKRLVCKREDKHLREEHFMPDPIAPKRPFGGEYGWVSPFILEVRKDLNLEATQRLPSRDETIISMIVEKAALGIIEEGKKIGKLREGEKIAKILMEKKDKEIKEVWECCAKLYTMDSFLYKKLNETMRLIGSDEHEKVWRIELLTKVHIDFQTRPSFERFLESDKRQLSHITNSTTTNHISGYALSTYDDVTSDRRDYSCLRIDLHYDGLDGFDLLRRRLGDDGLSLLHHDLLGHLGLPDITGLDRAPDYNDALHYDRDGNYHP
ncbi:unnamed protein product [Adineta steineri]|uniref:Uncharacterized protein n=1 Tax=Adineta steineri TaxID=433720 RepID=A0A815QH87_9BILA|nr:unnamed protein product [Adineta steineri]CAF4008134.1 unnamed protein product [Adineta steineri]